MSRRTDLSVFLEPMEHVELEGSPVVLQRFATFLRAAEDGAMFTVYGSGRCW